jgi:hypothetical protein
MPFDWPYWELGEKIWPCEDCKPWHVELFEDPASGAVWVREWHADDCPMWTRVSEEPPRRPDDAGGASASS